ADGLDTLARQARSLSSFHSSPTLRRGCGAFCLGAIVVVVSAIASSYRYIEALKQGLKDLVEL
ncbi:MAG: hypothetical protein ACR2LR_26020, partial [Hassallia sp.]